MYNLKTTHTWNTCHTYFTCKVYCKKDVSRFLSLTHLLNYYTVLSLMILYPSGPSDAQRCHENTRSVTGTIKVDYSGFRRFCLQAKVFARLLSKTVSGETVIGLGLRVVFKKTHELDGQWPLTSSAMVPRYGMLWYAAIALVGTHCLWCLFSFSWWKCTTRLHNSQLS